MPLGLQARALPVPPAVVLLPRALLRLVPDLSAEAAREALTLVRQAVDTHPTK